MDNKTLKSMILLSIMSSADAHYGGNLVDECAYATAIW